MNTSSITKFSKSNFLENEKFSSSNIIKQLIHFSLRTDANKIKIKIERNGLGFIEVKDNGEGISPKKLENLINSNDKLRNSDQILFKNLSGICQLEIISKKKNKTRGSLLKVTNDKIQPIKECYADIGTKILLTNIFYNNNIEKKNKNNFRAVDINKEIISYAVAYPHVEFLASVNNKVIVSASIEDKLSKDKTLSRINKIFGRKFSQSLIMENIETNDVEMKIYYSDSKKILKNQNNQFIFTNNEPTFFPEITKAFNDIYKKTFSVEVLPSFFIFLNYNSSLIKKEIILKMTKSLILKSFAKNIYKFDFKEKEKNPSELIFKFHKNYELFETDNGLTIRNINTNKRIEISLSSIKKILKFN